MMGNDTRQPASLEARLAVLCEAIAGLRAGNSRDHNLPPRLGGRSSCCRSFPGAALCACDRYIAVANRDCALDWSFSWIRIPAIGPPL